MSHFYFSRYLEQFLFHNFNITTIQGLVLVCLVVGITTVLLEGLKLARVFLNSQASRSPLEYARTAQGVRERPALVVPLLIPSSQWHIRKRRLLYHTADTLVYILQAVTGYMLMLAVMSYNAWVIGSVALGSAMGYFFLGAVRDYIIVHKDAIDTQNLQGSPHDSLSPLVDVLQDTATENIQGK